MCVYIYIYIYIYIHTYVYSLCELTNKFLELKEKIKWLK